MPSGTLRATVFDSPSPDGGVSSAVDNPSTLGHDPTNVFSTSGLISKTCRWRGFSAPGVQIVSLALKADWSVNGSLSGVSADSVFSLEYSLDGGSNYTTEVLRNDVVAPDSGSINVPLSTGQDLTQVRLHDFITAGGFGGSASLTASVSNIRIEMTYNAPPQFQMSNMM